MLLRCAYTNFVRAAMNFTMQISRALSLHRKVSRVHVRG
jgi:hypothetical protein